METTFNDIALYTPEILVLQPDLDTRLGISPPSRVSEKLRRDLGPSILALLQDDDVIEIMRNPDGHIWVERLAAGMSCIGTLPEYKAHALAATVAAMRGRILNDDQPVLECEMPDHPCRFTAAIPPAVEHVAFAIRRKASRLFTLDDYVDAGVLTPSQRRHIGEAVRARKNILIAGGTGSGKTTLVNAMKAEIADAAPDDRVVVIEDTPEIRCCSPNTVAIRTTRSVDLLGALRSSLRLRPDRIIVGEVRGPEALALLKAWNTGHPGGVATLHANDARSALRRLESLVAEATPAPMQEPAEVHADQGYRGHGIKDEDIEIILSRQKRGMTPAKKKRRKRRNAIEPIIGHCKNDRKTGPRNWLKGKRGDQINAIAMAVGFNLRKILKWIFACLLLKRYLEANQLGIALIPA